MRPVLLYLILVGVPLLGILALLRVGQTLSAPTSLAGSWSAQLSPNPHDSLEGVLLLSSGPTMLSISQSGPNLLLSFNDNQQTTLAGTVRDATINASLVRQGVTATTYGPTAETNAIFFRAKVDRQSDPHRLLGVLIFARGPVHTEVPLTAIRQGEVRKATGAQ
jgi:hypothetical protein